VYQIRGHIKGKTLLPFPQVCQTWKALRVDVEHQVGENDMNVLSDDFVVEQKSCRNDILSNFHRVEMMFCRTFIV
jgi:hypothetical protein